MRTPSTINKIDVDAPKTELASKARWWQASFQINWDQQSQPSWHFGPYIAEQVVSPLLKKHSNDILIWRFHRRAVPDTAGHRFSFLFFTGDEAARSIKRTIEKNTVLEKLIADRSILTVGIKPYAKEGGTEVFSTSDPSWTPIMQSSWPYFLMGLSQTWLSQCVQYSNKIELEAITEKAGSRLKVEDLEDHYKSVQTELTKIWREQGRHAYLHHLNAIYAYQPLYQRY